MAVLCSFKSYLKKIINIKSWARISRSIRSNFSLSTPKQEKNWQKVYWTLYTQKYIKSHFEIIEYWFLFDCFLSVMQSCLKIVTIHRYNFHRFHAYSTYAMDVFANDNKKTAIIKCKWMRKEKNKNQCNRHRNTFTHVISINRQFTKSHLKTPQFNALYLSV